MRHSILRDVTILIWLRSICIIDLQSKVVFFIDNLINLDRILSLTVALASGGQFHVIF